MKRTKTKSALVTSALAMLLCVAMLMGTTFAWFTDTASTGVNKIQAGNLDIQILDANGEEVTNLDWKTPDNRAQNEILWEPGATYVLEPFVIVNKGNLALQYKVEIDKGVTKNADGTDASVNLLDVIDFGIKYTLEPDNIEDADAAIDDKLSLGGQSFAGAASDNIYIIAKMKETAGNEYQGLYLDGMTITVYATQTPAEYDSFDNQYDAEATYPGSLPTEVTLSDADFTETTTNYGNYARERFAAAGLECVVDVYESTVPNPAAFKLTLEEAAEDQADFIITKEDGRKAYVKLVLEGYEADPTDPEISIEFIGATEIEEGTNSTYSFKYSYEGTNAEGEDVVSVAGIYKK